MSSAPQPEQEYARLLDLARYDILDTAPEKAFDRITRLAARTLRAPSAVLNFVDQDRQWGKSCFGTTDSTAPREHSFCAWTILSDEVLTVADARQDQRFLDNPLVLGSPSIRMYAGAPLTTPSGHRIGSLCVFGDAPLDLEPADLEALQDLAALVMDELELRLHNRALQSQVSMQGQQLQELRQLVTHAQVLEDINRLLDATLSPQEATLEVSRLIGTAIHADWTGLMAFEADTMTVQVAHHQPDLNPALLAFAARLPDLAGGVTRSLRNTKHTTYLEDYPQHPWHCRKGLRLGSSQPRGCHSVSMRTSTTC
ncbi:GAF domain-containing protein [Deinococcus malanensis]|uniref:GAF domain-containing protein n=1 Tax=Deinococcus malanensis TaxID=1706855 RepID=UPI003627D15A